MVMMRGMPGGRQAEVGSATGWPWRAASVVLRYFSAYSGVNGGVSGTPRLPFGSQGIEPTPSQMPFQSGRFFAGAALGLARAGAAAANAAKARRSGRRSLFMPPSLEEPCRPRTPERRSGGYAGRVRLGPQAPGRERRALGQGLQ